MLKVPLKSAFNYWISDLHVSATVTQMSRVCLYLFQGNPGGSPHPLFRHCNKHRNENTPFLITLRICFQYAPEQQWGAVSFLGWMCRTEDDGRSCTPQPCFQVCPGSSIDIFIHTCIGFLMLVIRLLTLQTEGHNLLKPGALEMQSWLCHWFLMQFKQVTPSLATTLFLNSLTLPLTRLPLQMNFLCVIKLSLNLSLFLVQSPPASLKTNCIYMKVFFLIISSAYICFSPRLEEGHLILWIFVQ